MSSVASAVLSGAAVTRRPAPPAGHAPDQPGDGPLVAPPRVQAQRKFAQGQSAPPSAAASPAKSAGPAARASGSLPSSNSSSSSSGPGRTRSPASGPLKPGERPKTEDFLTFLCLRGTSLLPQELDFFNQPTVSSLAESSSEDYSDPDDRAVGSSGVARRKEGGPSKNNNKVKLGSAGPTGKKIQASMQALRKKYTDQRIAKRVVAKTMNSVRKTRSSGGEAKHKSDRATRALRREANSGRRSPVKTGSVSLIARKPSAATLVAQRKSRMATLTAASSRVSRMLTRLTPRGTSSDAFVKSAKKIPLTGRSLRGRDISGSSDDEAEITETLKTPPKRKLKSRSATVKADQSESDADEETSSRDSSRKPVHRNSLEKPRRLVQPGELAYRKLSSKRDSRSKSRDSSGSKESGQSENSKPGRKAKDSLNMTAKPRPEESVSRPLPESKPERRLSEIEDAKKPKKKAEGSGTPGSSMPTKKVITPSIKKADLHEDSRDDTESEKKKRRDREVEKDKRKPKSSLKELQDMLLEEAKRKIGTTPPIMANECMEVGPETDERITISQRTGYIQVKPRMSTDQSVSGDEDRHTPKAAAFIGPDGRRLSKNGERTATPPRKILPKTDLDQGRSSSSPGHAHLPMGVLNATPTSMNPGLLGATSMSGLPIIHQQVPITSSNPMGMMQNPQQVPLTQPLVINTSFANNGPKSSVNSMLTASGIIVSNTGIRMPVQVPIQMRPAVSVGGVPTTVGTATGSFAGLPIINTAGGFQIAGMQQITMSGGIIQPVNTISVSTPSSTAIARPPYGYPQHLVAHQMPYHPVPQHTALSLPPHQVQPQQPHLGQSHQVPPQSRLTHMAPSSSAVPICSGVPASMQGASTGLTTSNTQPLLSPGPPMLSPQIRGKSSSGSKQSTQSKDSSAALSAHQTTSSKAHHNVPPNLKAASHSKESSQAQRSQGGSSESAKNKLPDGILPNAFQGVPSQLAAYGLLRHPGVPLQQPAMSQPQATMRPKHPHSQASKQHHAPIIPTASNTNINTPSKQKSQKSIFSKTTPEAAPKKVSLPPAASFKVENEASPYAFDSEPTEKPNAPFRKSKDAPGKANTSSSKPVQTSSNEERKTDKAPSSPKPSSSSNNIHVDLENATGSSIPIPKELANQLAAQAKKEGKAGNSEMTYFIPLQSSSGQSFGVAVKLGTEGPAGPNQKVIMKAKLVTQPSGKPVGARVISGKAMERPPADSPREKATTSSVKRFSRMPMASPVSPGSETDDSQPSTSTGRMGSPDSGRSSSMKKKHTKPRPTTKEEAECCLGEVERIDRFPKLGQHPHLIEAPVYKPTELEFKDPMKYIERIRKDAEPFGICKIIPPTSFRPECNVDDDMRFTSYSQYIQKMMSRWGNHSKEMAAIKKYLDTQNIVIKPHPTVSSVEIDLPALYHAVQSFGGLTEVIQRKRWAKIADYLRIPKGTQDRGNKLDDIYCKYLLPYDTLSEVEREELLRLVEDEHEEKLKDKLEKLKTEEGAKEANKEDDDDEEEEEEESEDEDYECVLKGKSTSLGQFFRVARNILCLIFKAQEPGALEVEEEYWRIVIDKDGHVQVHQGSIDTGDEGFGFPTSKSSSCGRHPWNLKILSNNPKSLLRCMGPVMGVTVPTLNVGMVFTTGCWYRDPHGLPWVEYLHTGASKIWYGIPDSHSIAFYTAMKKLVPSLCRNKKIWLPADTTMVPPSLLVKYGVSVCRTVQEPGQFLVVFPKAYSSYICSGYSLSESVYYAPKHYLDIAGEEFQNIRDSREPMMFPLPKLIICIAQDEMSSKDTLERVKPFLEKIRDNEFVKHSMIRDLGVKSSERIKLRSKKQEQDDEYECEICSENLYVSYVCDVKEDTYYCLDHAIEYLQGRKQTQRKNCKILYTHSKDEVCSIIKDLNKRVYDSDEDSSSSEDDFEVKRTIEVKKPFVSSLPSIPNESPMSSPSYPMLSPSSSFKGKAPMKRKSEGSERASPINSVKKPKKVEKPTPKAIQIAEEKESKLKKRKKEALAALNPPSSSSKRRSGKARKVTNNKSGNLAVELLDMLLSESDSEDAVSASETESSDESWK